MKRKELLMITGCAPARFETLQAREQLPFVSRGRQGEYDLRDAMLLRAFLDLIAPDNEGRSALGVDLASTLVFNAAGYAGNEFGPEPKDMIGQPRPVWFAGAEFVELGAKGKDGAPLRFLAWYAGAADGIGAFLTHSSARCVRIVGAVNATDAALKVMAKAEAFGVSDA